MAKKTAETKPKKLTAGAPLPLTTAPTEAEAAVWTPEELPFVREVHALPHDDAPRLVFADWLEERGDLRAEFIRVQCQLANLRVRDAEYAALDARANALIAKHRAAWLRPYPKLPATTWGIHGAMSWNFDGKGGMHHFTRGFNAAIHPKSFPALMRRASLIVDELGAGEIDYAPRTAKEAKEMSKLPQLARVTALVLTGAETTEPILESPNLGPLWRLDLGESTSAKGLRAFLDGPSSHRLRWLSLRTDKAKVFESLLAWKNLEQLDTLMVDSATPKILEAIAASKMRPSRLAFATDDSSSAKVRGHCAKLFRSPAFSETTAIRIDHLHGKLGDLAKDFPLPPRTSSLDLTALIGDDEVAAMAKSKAFGQLEHLSLSCYAFAVDAPVVKDAGALALAKASNLAKLKSLDLSGSSITDVGAKALVESEALASLVRLNLERTGVTREAKAGLRKVFRGKLEV